MRSLVLLGLTCLLAPAALAEEKPKTLQMSGNVVQADPILFETASDKIKPESKAALEAVKDFLDAKPYVSTLRIENHSDNQGKPDANLALTKKRALAIAKSLVDLGVDCKLLLPVGFGGTKPIAPNDSPENRAANRRTQFVVAGLRNLKVGGMPLDGNGQIAGDPCD